MLSFLSHYGTAPRTASREGATLFCGEKISKTAGLTPKRLGQSLKNSPLRASSIEPRGEVCLAVV